MSVARASVAALCALLAAAWSAAAETVIGPETFETFSRNQTFYFSQQGVPYGAEQYLSDRRVIWRFADGTCDYGQWFEDGGSLCFVYERMPVPQCWLFVSRDGAYFARPRDTAPKSASELLLDTRDTRPLACPAPDLGV